MKNLNRIKEILLTLFIGVSVAAINLNGQDYSRAQAIQSGHGISPAHRIVGPDHDMMFNVHNEDSGPVTFLGVHANPVDPTLSVQLGLPEHMGLAIRYVVPESPAEKAGLKPHDILRMMDDQILIHPFQLRVLVRAHEEGDEVAYTVLREGKEIQVKVELIKKEPAKYEKFKKMGQWFQKPGHPGEPFGFNLDEDSSFGLNFDYLDEDMDILVENAARVGENVEEILRNAFNHTSEVTDHVINSLSGHSTILKMQEKEIILQDENGSLRLTVNNGSKYLVVTDKEENTLFDGPVNTEEERSKIPTNILPKLQKLESENNFEFDSDEKFEPGDIEITPISTGIGVSA